MIAEISLYGPVSLRSLGLPGFSPKLSCAVGTETWPGCSPWEFRLPFACGAPNFLSKTLALGPRVGDCEVNAGEARIADEPRIGAEAPRSYRGEGQPSG
jgi:hypothetical protein